FLSTTPPPAIHPVFPYTTLFRSKLIPFIDPIDVRYNRFEAVPKPVTQAVMFCLMDVSGSMTESMKDLAKRFFMLLYLFLERRYRDRKSTRLNSSHVSISYAVFCL